MANVWLSVLLVKSQTAEPTNSVQLEEFEESNTAFPQDLQAWLEPLHNM
jgi:hypothetical protein